MGTSRWSDWSDDVPTLTMWCMTAIESYSGSPESGGIFTIALEPELYMISQIILLKMVRCCSAWLVHRWISTYPLRWNGKLTTGKEEVHFLLPLSTTITRHRLLFWPWLIADGNMKLVHLIMKWPEDNISLSDGELFMVRWALYVEHLAHAPQRQPVSSHWKIVNLWADMCQEIKMQ